MKRIALLLPALLAGCAVGPNYHRPEPTAAATAPFRETASGGPVTSDPVTGAWWRLFDDPVLDRLIDRALARNTDIREAAANLARARAILSEARSERLPTTDASAGYSRQRTNTSSFGFGGAGGKAPTIDYFRLGFDASYEVDLFGRVSRSIEAARADRDAAAAALAGARVSIAAETARTYAQACSFAEQADVARTTLDLQQRSFGLTRRQFEAGRSSRRDVASAEVLAQQAAAQVPANESERRAALYALAALTGDTPAELDMAAAQCKSPPRVRVAIPVGDGAALLRRRPDVAEAERSLAAANARIGVATADYFPRISLLGSASLGATTLGDLGDSRAFGFSLGPLISWSFPNIAATDARVRQARASTQAARARFDGTVLGALKEVEQALARYAGSLDEQAALARAEAASADAARLTRLRYQAGAENFLQLLDAERSLATARAALAQANGRVSENQVALFKALGGGWEAADAKPAP
jgi:NodT family efflux transporter outer membrane factor (OMF) lipoprotein